MNQPSPRPSRIPPNPLDESSDRLEQPNAGTEQRAATRVHVDAEVSLVSASNFFAGLTRNLSNGGVFVATLRRLPVGTPVDLVLTLPDGPVATRGRVCWVRESTEGVAPGIGVMFEGLSDDDRVRIEAFCARRSPDRYDVEP
jgi:uncharacterized protein (TIGR02266 family)